MNCSKCVLEITARDSSLKCRGVCGNHLHFECLSSANKAYKKSLIAALNGIPNLLWFCDDCLPNTINALSSRGSDTQSHAHNHTNQSPEDLSDIAPDMINVHTQRQPDNAISSVSTSLTDLDQQDESIQMTIDENTTISTGNIESNACKKRRLSIDGVDNAAERQIPIIPAAPRRISTNYRCIYLSPYPPSMIESAVREYAVSGKNRDATEIMECKRLLPAKCRTV